MSDFNIVAYGKSDFNDIIRLAKKAGFKCKKDKKGKFAECFDRPGNRLHESYVK